jgi:hypothetical protein
MGWMKEMMLAASWAEPLEIKMAAKLDKLMVYLYPSIRFCPGVSNYF